MGAILHRDAATFNGGLTSDFVFVNYDGHHEPKGEPFRRRRTEGILHLRAANAGSRHGVAVLSYNAIVRQNITDDDQHIPVTSM